MAALAVLLAWQAALVATWPEARRWAGLDYRTYTDAARSWLGGSGFYHAYQLAGPYRVVATEILYPPPVLLLLAPFAVLPAALSAALWWGVPLGITAAVVVSWRPSRWGWAAVLALLVLPFPKGMSWAEDVLFNGNPAMWAMAAVALATRWPAFGPLVLLKPTLAPFALVGVRSRAWWAGLAALGLACLAFAPMWPDYLAVAANARTAGPAWLYSAANTTLLAVPIVARLTAGGRG